MHVFKLIIYIIIFASLAFLLGYSLLKIRDILIMRESTKIIRKHSFNLGREKSVNSFVDPYGIRRYEKWKSKGIDYFYTKVFLPSHSARRAIEKNSILKLKIYKLVDIVATQNEFLYDHFSDNLTGEQFEIFCEKELLLAGWDVKRTPLAGDFGVDLVAQKKLLRVCIQCKKYSKPVGSSAVQEVVAGKAHYQGTHCVVVSNNSFTKKASQLAISNRVILLHYSELHNLLSKIVG